MEPTQRWQRANTKVAAARYLHAGSGQPLDIDGNSRAWGTEQANYQDYQTEDASYNIPWHSTRPQQQGNQYTGAQQYGNHYQGQQGQPSSSQTYPQSQYHQPQGPYQQPTGQYVQQHQGYPQPSQHATIPQPQQQIPSHSSCTICGRCTTHSHTYYIETTRQYYCRHHNLPMKWLEPGHTASGYAPHNCPDNQAYQASRQVTSPAALPQQQQQQSPHPQQQPSYVSQPYTREPREMSPPYGGQGEAAEYYNPGPSATPRSHYSGGGY